MESKQLVRLVMERVDAASAEAFAERMGWSFNQVRTIRLWLAGTSAPSYPYPDGDARGRRNALPRAAGYAVRRSARGSGGGGASTRRGG